MNDVVKPTLSSGGHVKAIVPQDFDGCWRIAQAVTSAGMAPKGLEKPEQAMVAIMHGLEVGLTPMASLQSIAVVNGRPTIWGDGAIALVRSSGHLESIKEKVVGDGLYMVATCEVRRKGEDAVTSSFSAADAKTAGLWGKSGPWTQYPKRMLTMRARAFALRDTFADILRGLKIREEVEDYEMKDVTPTPPKPPEPPQASQDERKEPEVPKTPPKPEPAPADRSEVEDAIVEDVRDEPETEGVAAPIPEDTTDFLELLEERISKAETVDDIEEIWTEFDPMAKFEGSALDQGIAKAIKRRYTRRVGG